jgi:hypothetical protein
MIDYPIIPSADFFIHFDVASHKIPIEQSIITERSVKIIIEELNKNIFGGDLDIQIFVFPDEKGGYLKTFLLGTLLGGSLFSLAPDVINGIVMGLGDGREIKEYVRDWTIDSKNISNDLITFTKSFLEKDTHSLESSGISKEQFYRAYEAKNEFYRYYEKNSEWQALGFDNSEKFPISRNQFPYRIAEFGSGKKEIIERRIHLLKVVSAIHAPENAEDSWRVKNIAGGPSENVYMKDKKFYKFYWKKDLKIHTLLAQVKYTIEEDEIGNRKFKDKGKEIEEIFEYDNISFSPLPRDYENQMESFPLKLKNTNSEGFEEEKEISGADQESLF